MMATPETPFLGFGVEIGIKKNDTLQHGQMAYNRPDS